MEAFNGSLMYALPFLFALHWKLTFSACRPYSEMPVYWRWLYQMSPFQHYVRSMLGTLLHGIQVECAPSELVQYATPEGLT